MYATSRFVVYVDESGDEGFQFEKGSPEWFVLAALVVPRPADPSVLRIVDIAREVLGRPDKKPLHFRKLKHEHRKPFLKSIAAHTDLHVIAVAVHKPSLHAEIFRERNYLYHYALRLVLERVTALCGALYENVTTADEREALALWQLLELAAALSGREATPPAELEALLKAKGDGSAKVELSSRGQLSLAHVRTYMQKLVSHGKLRGNVIQPEQVEVHMPERVGLQLADAVASSVFFALQPNQYGDCEEAYVRMLMPRFYTGPSESIWDHGIKLFPPRECVALIKNTKPPGVAS